MSFELAGRSDVGILRAGRANEDALAFSLDAAAEVVMLAVADGVGGAPGGDRASQAAVAAFRAVEPGSEPATALREAVKAASAAVRTVAEDAPELSGAGTTIVFAYAADDQAWIANLGDSRAYHWREGELRQISVDHSWVQQEVTAGRITAEEARSHPRRNLITRALNTDRKDDEADYFEVTLAAGDRLLLCTDGLHGPLDDATIGRLLSTRASAEELAGALIDAAIEAGGPDNVTVVVLRVSGDA